MVIIAKMVVQYENSEQRGLDVEVIMNMMKKMNNFESRINRALKACGMRNFE